MTSFPLSLSFGLKPADLPNNSAVTVMKSCSLVVTFVCFGLKSLHHNDILSAFLAFWSEAGRLAQTILLQL
jgi:hypothetical protein